MAEGLVILAAGAGARLGGVAKALLRRGDVTYLERILATARTAGCVDELVVVGPPHGAAVTACARALGIRVIENPEPARGMASSVALGFAALASAPAHLEAAWLWPVDHPDVSARTLRLLVAALRTHDAAQPQFGGRGGHPPLVGRALWPALAACADVEGGARAVLHAADVIRVDVDDAGVVRDVDTPADLVEVH